MSKWSREFFIVAIMSLVFLPASSLPACYVFVVQPKKPFSHAMSILTGRQITWFSHLCSSKITYLNLTKIAAEILQTRGINLKQITLANPKIWASKNFFIISSFFLLTLYSSLYHTFYIFDHKLQTYTLIKL